MAEHQLLRVDSDGVEMQRMDKERSPGGISSTSLDATTGEEALLKPLDYSKSEKFHQYLAAIAATLGAASMGTVLAYTSPVIPELKDPGSGIEISKTQESWIGSLMNVGALIGGLTAGFLVGGLGKKGTIVANCVPFLIGWVLLISAQNVAMLYIGRIITGLCCGYVSMSAPVYIGEIAQPEIRGTLGAGFQLMVTLGILFVNLCGLFMPWRWIGVACAFIVLANMIAMLPMPESPAHLVNKGRERRAEKALDWLRGPFHDVQQELKEVQMNVMATRAEKASFSDLFTDNSARQPLLLSLGLMLFQQLSGINAVIFYTESIFEEAQAGLSPSASTMIVMITQVVVTCFAAGVVDRLGRRILLLVSDALMAIALLGLGIFFYIKDSIQDDDLTSSYSWLPVVSLVTFIVAFSLGYGPIPWLMMGELMPSKTRAPASSLATGFNWTMSFIVTLTFNSLQDGLGAYGCFWLYSAICVGGTVFVFFLIPETKGKSLDEIQKLFRR
ncbi:unnamed protein product [Cyprideis torosa]|uniref:Uncharacterized protein n=1 Tax=Cyprideis torosa TaxID=163714 RepID=A0A7R8WAI9_9CRUS|nr:unnamed protein product [Cyprideis torosa]CAG0889699.1 unnamed protein product [Cyprideis torosa]